MLPDSLNTTVLAVNSFAILWFQTEEALVKCGMWIAELIHQLAATIL
jgi:hypothetical protein